jgi:cation:H+ antiporter
VTIDLILVGVGFALLARGADVFVVSAARLAVTLDLSRVVIGAVVVGFGTGLPELVVSTSAAARGSLDIAAGNIVGSNLANLTLVLGVAGLMARPEAVPRVLRREAPLSLAAVAIFAVVLQGGLSRAEGAALLVVLAAMVVLMLRATEPAVVLADVDAAAVDELVEEVDELVEEAGETPVPGEADTTSRDVIRAVLALASTVAGAQTLIIGARSIATAAGLSGGFVGLTLVAIGTSLPELVTAVQSARRGETALLVGNVLGSNIFNSTAVAGSVALVGPGPLREPGLTVLAATSMVVTAALAWLFLGLGGRLRRWEAAVLLAVYAATLPLST